MSEAAKRFEDALREAIARSPDEGIGIAFSGGLDSTVLAKLYSDVRDVHLYVVGMEGRHDIVRARGAASDLGLPISERIISFDDIEATLPKVSKIANTKIAIQLSYLTPLFLIAENIDERIVVTGQGSDELLGGYKRYGNMDDSKAMESMKLDVEALWGELGAMESALVESLGKELVRPFIDKSVVEVGLSLSRNDRRNKQVLRDVARNIGLPDYVVEGEKKAIQYGTGVTSAINRECRIRKIAVSDYFESLTEK